MSKYILAHDLGTSGNKATLFSEDGVLIASQTASYKTLYASENRAEQNPGDWWKAVKETTNILVKKVGKENIAGVALSGQMMGCLCVDKNGRPLHPHMLYCDQRSLEQEKQISSKISADSFYEITGHRISASYSIEKLMWLRDNKPEIFANTYKILNAKDYINFLLSGVMVTDPSDASGTNAYDINSWQWSEKIMQLAELDMSLLPDVKNSIDVIGEITNWAATETGLKAGTPVICGGGDGSCAGVGVGCVSEGSAYNYLGSSSWIALTVKKPVVDNQMRTMNWAHVVPGLLHPSGTMQTAGAAHGWMARELCGGEYYQSENTGENIFSLADKAIATSSIGANKLLFLPYLLGERTPRWDVDAKAAFVGLTLNHTHADMLRAVMEGITMNLGLITNIFRQHVHINEMMVIGGGAQSKIWRQMMADIYDVEITIPNYLEEATSMGAAVLAGIGAGVFQDFSVTERFIKIVDRVQPIAGNREKYRKLMPLFDNAYYALKEINMNLSKLNLE